MKKLTKLAPVLAICLIFLLSVTACNKGEDVMTPIFKELQIKGHDYLVVWNGTNFGRTYLHDPGCRAENR